MSSGCGRAASRGCGSQQQRHGRGGQHRRPRRVHGQGGRPDRDGPADGDGAAAQHRGGVGLRDGAGVGGEGQLLVAGRSGRPRRARPDAGPAPVLPVELGAAARSAGRAGRRLDPRPTRGSDRAGDRDRRDRAAEEGRGHRVRGTPARRVHRRRGELRDHRVQRLRHRERAGLGRLRRVHAAALGVRCRPSSGRRDPRGPGVRDQAAAGRQPAGPAAGGRIPGPVGRVRRGLRTQRTTAHQSRRARPGLCGDHPLRLPDPAALRRDDPGRPGRRRRGVRTPILRERIQRAPLQRLGPDHHRHPGAVPADPAAALPPRQLHLLPVLGPTGPAGHQLGRARARCPGCPRVRFPCPPAEPDVRLSPHPALHVSCPLLNR